MTPQTRSRWRKVGLVVGSPLIVVVSLGFCLYGTAFMYWDQLREFFEDEWRRP